MGTRLPETSPDGPFTNFCWLNELFTNPENPPLYVRVKFENIEKGDLWAPPDPEPPNNIYVVEQIDLESWQLITAGLFVEVTWFDFFTTMGIGVAPPSSVFIFVGGGGPCITSAVNQLTNPGTEHFVNGTATILEVS